MFPSNLARITVGIFVELDCSSIKALRQLPNLQVLKLRHGTIPGPLDCATGDFPKLQVFEMADLRVKSWKLAKGAMPALQSLLIDECSKLRVLPEQLWSLTTLSKVRVINPSLELANSLKHAECSCLVSLM
ncbi:hypothetical protein PIB30_068710 [Stylosanthes scabra]|uniref:Disease resistance protein n=1 Tax=Stylosanthes scabra TaxID=79078 RepID=A0ABU6VRB4_9FABA|nr:hypothetical protein [Stylosanthes scabra]